MKRSLRYSDEELLKGLVARDETVLKELYKTYFPGTRRFIMSNQGREEDAYDLFQEALMVLFQKARVQEFKLTCSFGTYLYSVVRFLWLKELEKKKRMLKKPVDFEDYTDPDSSVLDIAELNERMRIYREQFEKLSADCRKVLSLFLEGITITEITRIMGYRSEQHTRNRRYRCKLSLIKRIRALYGGKENGYGNNGEN